MFERLDTPTPADLERAQRQVQEQESPKNADVKAQPLPESLKAVLPVVPLGQRL